MDRRTVNRDLRSGYYVETGNMIPGAGWLAAGPGYRRWYGKDAAVLDASAALSWNGYKMARARFEFTKLADSRLAVGSELRLNDYARINYFGTGPDTVESSHAQYRLQSTNLVGYATYRPARWVGVTGSIGWLDPTIESRAGFFKGDEADARALFPGDIVFAVPEQPSFIHSEFSVTADRRDFPGHPTSGGLYRAAASNFSDRGAGLFDFRRYELEGAHFVPLADSRVVVALHGFLAASDTSDGGTVPFYLQPTLGGHNSLRSFADYRFHDRNMLVLNVETRVAMMTHIDAAVFLDAGNVAPKAGDLNLDKRSYGAGLRFHSRRQTFARVDVARGSEGWRLLFRLNDPLELTRVLRRTAPAPFVH